MRVTLSTVALPMTGEPEARDKMAQVTGEAKSLEVRECSSVAELMNQAGVPFDPEQKALVNGREVDLSHILRDGDAVALFGPINGM